MERIKQALERARADRDGVDEHRAEPQEVVYVKTRKLQLDPAYLRRRRVVTDVDDEEAGPAYKMLRTLVKQRMRANGWNTLGVTGAREGIGKTLTTLNLAIGLARDTSQTVLVVDLDLRRPTLKSYLTEEPALGLSDYLKGTARIEEILVSPGIDRLVVLPGNEAMSDSSDQLSGKAIAALAKDLKHRYADRFVLFDLPPLLAGDDVIAFAPNLDATLLVVADAVTTKDDLRRAYELLDPARILGTVLNMADSQPTAYGYA